MTDTQSSAEAGENRFALGSEDYRAARRAGVVLAVFAVISAIKLPCLWAIASPEKKQGVDAVGAAGMMLASSLFFAVVSWQLYRGRWLILALGISAFFSLGMTGGLILSCCLGFGGHWWIALFDATLVSLMWTALIILLRTRWPRSGPVCKPPPAGDSPRA